LKPPVATVFSMLKGKRRRPLSIEEINEAARQGWAGEPGEKQPNQTAGREKPTAADV
jgi:hypothetical protein